MANTNMATASSIYGGCAQVNLTTSYQTLLTTASSKIIRINSIIVSNIDGANACDVTIEVNSVAIAKTVSVPADSSLVVISKDTGLYLLEGIVLRAYASANSDLSMTVCYEEIG